MLSSQYKPSHNENSLLHQAMDKCSNTGFPEFPPKVIFLISAAHIFASLPIFLCYTKSNCYILFVVNENMVTDAGWKVL